MQPAENKDYSRDVILRLSPIRNTIIVEEQKPGGIAAYREIDPLELYYVINQSYASNDYLDSGFLPEHCLHLSMSATEKYFVLWNPELRADVIYGDKEYPNFPIPRMVFGVRVLENGKVAECSMGVVADETPTVDTPMFFYPFSNVHSDDRVCTGNNVLPRYRKISALRNFPRYLLGLPDNDDKMTEEFYLAVKKEIAAYQEKCDYLIKSSSQSPAVMDRWVLKVQALEEKKRHYEGVLQRELDGLDDEFSVLKLLSQELQVRARSIRSQRFQQKAA